MSDPIHALRQAIPYIRLYKDKVFVVKVGRSEERRVGKECRL